MTARAERAAPLLLLIAIAALVRLVALGTQSFWSDEAITALLVRRDFGSLLSGIADTESTPPLYYVAAWLWAKVAGTDEVGLRSLSVVFGVLAVPVAYGAARALVSSRAAFIAGVLVAVNPLLVWYSQEARAYSLLVLLCGISFWAFVVARESGSGRALACWWLASSLAIATHYFAVLVVAVMAGWLLASRTPRAWLAVAGVGGALLALAPLALAQRSGGHAEYIADSALTSRLVNLTKQFLAGRDAPRDQAIAVLVAAIVALALVALVRSRDRTSLHGALVGAIVGGVPVVLSLALIPFGADYVNTQNSLGSVVPLTVAVAIAFAAVRRRGAGAVGVAAVCVLWLAVTWGIARDPAFQRADWRAAFAAATAGDEPARGRLFVVGPDYEGWFARAPARVYLDDVRSVDPLERTAKPFRPLVRDDEPAGDGSAPDEVVFLLLGSGVDQREAERLLAPGYRRIETRDGDGFQLVRYDVSGSERTWRATTPPATLSGAPVAALYVP
jgi:predicted membrane-bound mannosyltransferase